MFDVLKSLLTWGSDNPQEVLNANPELLKMNNFGQAQGNATFTSLSPSLTDSAGGLLKSLWGSAFDSKDKAGLTTQGWLSPVMGVAQGIGSAYMGMKQYGLAQESLKEQQRQFNLNYQNQRKLTNSMLEDRQRARIASNPTAYQSVGDYMKQYGV